MPAYDFKCPDCEKTYELTMRMSALDELKAKDYEMECPECKVVSKKQKVLLAIQMSYAEPGLHRKHKDFNDFVQRIKATGDGKEKTIDSSGKVVPVTD